MRSQEVLTTITVAHIKVGQLEKAFQLFREIEGGGGSDEFQKMCHFLAAG